MVFLCVELGKGRVEVRAHLRHDLFAPLEHLRAEHTTPILVMNTKWTCRWWTTLRPRLILGSGSRLGVGGRSYVVCREVPPVSECRAGSAPVGAVRPRPVRVEPWAGAAPDVAALAGPNPGI